VIALASNAPAAGAPFPRRPAAGFTPAIVEASSIRERLGLVCRRKPETGLRALRFAVLVHESGHDASAPMRAFTPIDAAPSCGFAAIAVFHTPQADNPCPEVTHGLYCLCTAFPPIHEDRLMIRVASVAM